MKVKGRDGNMLFEGNAVRHIWDEDFDELLNECGGWCTGEHCGGTWRLKGTHV